MARSVHAAPSAAPHVVAGKSLNGIALGASRVAVVARLQKSLGKRTLYQTHTFAQGLTEDVWILGDIDAKWELFSRDGKVVQINEALSADQPFIEFTFAQLLKRYDLQKSVYHFNFIGDADDENGYLSFFYDDFKRGVGYGSWTQSPFDLNLHPNEIIVHRPGVAIISIEQGIVGRLVTDPQFPSR